MAVKRADAPAIRCAIHTRKTTEEGLEREFNSLDAQREAGEAYIASQRGEGWTCLTDRYDDGSQGSATLTFLGDGGEQRQPSLSQEVGVLPGEPVSVTDRGPDDPDPAVVEPGFGGDREGWIGGHGSDPPLAAGPSQRAGT